MSFFWWMFGSLFLFIALYYTFVALDKHATKRKLRQGAIVRTGTGQGTVDPAAVQGGTTVIYTIPTTRQLSQQYPQMVTTYPHPVNSQNSPPPYIDLPPTYDQVVIYPATNTTITHSPAGTQVNTTTTHRANVIDR